MVTSFESNLHLNWKRMSIIKVGLHEIPGKYFSLKQTTVHLHDTLVQRHSKNYETNCSNCSKSTKIGTHVD